MCSTPFFPAFHALCSTPQRAPRRTGRFCACALASGQGEPHLPLRDMVRGIHAALWAAVQTPQDIALQAGATH